MVVSSHDLCEHESILFYHRGESNRIDLPGMLPFRSKRTPARRCVKKSFATQKPPQSVRSLYAHIGTKDLSGRL